MACVRRATEFNPLRRIEALPGRLLPPYPTVPRTVGLRTSCPRTTACGLHRPQIWLSKGRGGRGSASRSVAPFVPRRAREAKPCCRAPRHQPGGVYSSRPGSLGTGAAGAAGMAARVSGRYRQAETSRRAAHSTRPLAVRRERGRSGNGGLSTVSILYILS